MLLQSHAFCFQKTAAKQDFDGLLRGGARHHESGFNASAGGKGVNVFAVGAAGPKNSKESDANKNQKKTIQKPRKSEIKPRTIIGNL